MSSRRLCFFLLCFIGGLLSTQSEYMYEFDDDDDMPNRSRRDVPKMTTATEPPNVTEDSHLYYNSRYIPDGSQFFIDLQKDTEGIEVLHHKKSSQSYRKAYKINLDFDFMYYGNIVNNIIITTGGFINIGPRFHTFVHRVHYIAPLMADFNPSASNDSKIYLGKGRDVFIVQWTDMILNGSTNSSEKFTFQAVLHRNGTIYLAYKDIPYVPSLIPNTTHTTKVGVADGFIITYKYQNPLTKRTVVHNYIYTYHKVVLPLQNVKSGAVYKLDMLPNCLQFNNCRSCLSSKTSFKCRWCPSLNRCSDSLEWNRSVWLKNKCNIYSYADTNKCSAGHGKVIKKKTKTKKVSSAAVIGGVVGVMLFLLTVFALCLFGYSYTHPQSKSGMWLIEHHPRRWQKRRRFEVVNDEELL